MSKSNAKERDIERDMAWPKLVAVPKLYCHQSHFEAINIIQFNRETETRVISLGQSHHRHKILCVKFDYLFLLTMIMVERCTNKLYFGKITSSQILGCHFRKITL